MTKLVIITFIAITILVAIFPNILFCIVKPVSVYVFKSQTKYRPYGIATLILLAVWFLLFVWGMFFGRFRYHVNRFDYHYDGPATSLPQSFDGYRIAIISDLHLDGWVGHEKKLQEIIDTLNSQNADMVVFAGDLVSLKADEADHFLPLLKRIKARDGIISIMGNHDYLPYDGVPPFRNKVNHYKEIQYLQHTEREKLGWRLLLNENIILHHNTDSIAILGCENQSLGAHPIIQRGNLKKTMQGTDGMFRILLTHDPSQWDVEVKEKTQIPLTISGHTHAGQVNFFGFRPANLFIPRLFGLYTQGSQTLYVTSGLGGAMPLRIGATPEITVITLRN